MTAPSGVVVTGAHGFLGWHTACRLRARYGVEPTLVGRADFADPDLLVERLRGAEVVLHLAGVNRAETAEAVEHGNVEIAERLAAAIRVVAAPVRVVYADSVQADGDTPYGRGKAIAAEVLGKAVAEVGGSLADVRLPNLFGEHGRPAYNSFVATFAHAVASGERPTVTDDREIALLHAQDAAAALWSAAGGTADETLRPTGEPVAISRVLALLEEFQALYARRGEIPALTDRFRVALFNTYRSYLPLAGLPLQPEGHRDARGELFEAVRMHGGTGQVFVSTTRPGATRGNHYHLEKVERFFVVRGEAQIELRRLLHDEVTRIRVGGGQPGFVDMPTLWVHNITNVGEEDLVTVFWTDQLLDPADPDQYPERV